MNKIRIKNFQSHEDTELEIPDGLTVLYGPSDNGKSVVVRAARWCILNRPNGDLFRMHDTKETSVQIETENFIVERRRSDKENVYEMDEEVYKALRTAVPEDIYISLNMNEANIQSQKETFFLIDKKPGQVSKKLNEVAGLSVMDDVTKIVNSEVRAINADVNATNKQLIEIQQNICDLEWVDEADKFLIKLENYKNNIDELDKKHTFLFGKLTALNYLRKKKEKFLSPSCVKDLKSLLSYYNLMQDQEDYHYRISSIRKRIKNLRIKRKQTVSFDTSEIEKLYSSLQSEKKRYDRIQNIIRSISILKKKHIAKKSQAEKSLQKHQRRLKEIGVCPMCKREI